MTLTIQHLPTTDAGTDATICEGDMITLGGSATNYSSVLWTTAGDGTFNDATMLSAKYTPGQNDIINGSVMLSLTATAALPCTTGASSNMTLSIVKHPVVNLGNDTIICKNDSITLDAGNPGCNYTWSTNATTQKITVTSPVDAAITYYVIVTNSNGCLTTASITVTYVTCTSIGMAENTPLIKIFPNPNDGNCRLQICAERSRSIADCKLQIEMRIMNIHGQLIYIETINPNKSTYYKELNLSNLTKGVYFINFIGRNFVKTEKIVIH
jgi:hypothetical protein